MSNKSAVKTGSKFVFDKKLLLDFNKLPENVSISTMTITCKLGTIINLENFAKYVDLDLEEIASIRFGKNDEVKRTLIEEKPKKKKKKNTKRKKSFYNQATLQVKPLANKYINVKLFKNGSVQMTGCKSIKDTYDVLKVLLKNLKVEKAILVDGEIIEKKYVEDISKLCITDFKVVMINSNFKVNFLVNREELYKILIEEGVTCTYEPCIHACVNIKYKYSDENGKNEKIISIFVFQSGSIIITGANNINHIIESYNYITKKLDEKYDKIVKKKLDDILKNDKILEKYLKMNNMLKFKTVS